MLSFIFIIADTLYLCLLLKISMEVFSIRKNGPQMNEEVRDREVRLIDTDGAMLGVMSSEDAQKIAITKNLDLVKIVPNAEPPVCRIMDYGKSAFEQAKKEKEAGIAKKSPRHKHIEKSSKDFEGLKLDIDEAFVSKFLLKDDIEKYFFTERIGDWNFYKMFKVNFFAGE